MSKRTTRKTSRRPIETADVGIMAILSPAKTLSWNNDSDRLKDRWTQPDCDPTKTKEIASQIKSKSKKALKKLLGISDKLVETAHEYWTRFQLESTTSDVKPAIFAFAGAAYQGLQADKECSDDDIRHIQGHLRIIDPVYGVLRPLDQMQAYRLEMATKNVVFEDKKTPVKLADYWKSAVTKRLVEDMKENNSKILLNLASDEYSAAVDGASDGLTIVKVNFWQEGRTIALHAKRARGLMVRYMAKHKVEKLEQLQAFDWEGYQFDSNHSDSTTLTFDRPKPGSAGSKRSRSSSAQSKKKKQRTARRSS